MSTKTELHGMPANGIEGDTVRTQEAAQFWKKFAISTIDAISANLCVIDRSGTIVAANAAWRQFYKNNSTPGNGMRDYGIGTNYLGICRDATNGSAEEAGPAAAGIRAVINGEIKIFTQEYPCHSPEQQRWFAMTVTPLGQDAEDGAVIAHTDITKHRQTEEMLLKLSTAVDQSSASVVITDLEGCIQYVNPRFTEVTGYTAVDAIGQNPRILGSRQTAKAIYRDMWNTISSGLAWRGELLNMRKDGELYWDETHIAPVKSQAGKVTNYVAIKTDITERKRDEAKLAKSESRLRTIIDNEPECITIVDAQGRLTQMNPAGLAMFEADSLEQVVGKLVQDLIAPEYRSAFVEMHNRVVAGESMQMEFEVLGIKGGRRWLEAHAVPLQEDGKTVHLAVTRDITERRQMEEQVRQLAFYDPLTRLPNRRLLNDRLRQAMTASKRSGRYGALMYLDLDNFKPLNDTHGHEVGDLLLIEAAERLKHCVRGMDTVARFGGDEFVVILSDLHTDKAESTAQADFIAEKIRTTLSVPYLLTVRRQGEAEATVEHRCTASIGVALFRNHEASQDDLLKWADTAMYQAKESGRNTIRFYESMV